MDKRRYAAWRLKRDYVRALWDAEWGREPPRPVAPRLPPTVDVAAIRQDLGGWPAITQAACWSVRVQCCCCAGLGAAPAQARRSGPRAAAGDRTQPRGSGRGDPCCDCHA